MLPRSEQEVFGQTGQSKRFQAEEARGILERAAAEQARRERELDDSYSLEELEEIASEAGISREALHKAIGKAPKRGTRRQTRASAKPWFFSRGVVVAGISGIVLLAILLAVPEMAYALLIALLLLLILVLFAG